MFSVNKEDNIILRDLSKEELVDLFHKINETPLQFRRTLHLPEYITFGNEIEIDGVSEPKAKIVVEMFNDVHYLEGNERYEVHQEATADAEIVTPIMSDTEKHWENFYDMYSLLEDTGATISGRTSSHLHFGTHKINTPEKLSLFLKTLVVFEAIIFKFGYGYDTEPREYLQFRPGYSVFSVMMTPKKVAKFTDALDHYNHKSQSIMFGFFSDFIEREKRFRPVFNFGNFDFNKLHYEIASDIPSTDDHFEVRCFNGTQAPEIAQNNVNLIARIELAVLEDKIDKDYVLAEYAKYKKKRYSFNKFCALFDEDHEGPQYNRLLNGFNKVKLDKALRLADMIFDTELDKCFFLKQYLKLYEESPEYVEGLVK